MLHLNDTKVKGSNLKVSVTLAMDAEDSSGQSSNTATSEKGDKAKQLQVKLLVKYDDVKNLNEIVELAEAKNDKNEREVYTVVNDTAKAVGLRKARFQGGLTVREDETLRLWRVTFKLSEVQSVSEAKEARTKDKPVTDQKAKGNEVEKTSDAVPSAEELSSVEKVLKWADDAISGASAT